MGISAEETSRIEKQIESELSPYLETVKSLTKGSKEDLLLNKAYQDLRAKFHPTWKKFDLLTIDFPTEYKNTTLKDQVYEMFAYLVLVESLGNNMVNMIIMLLRACGRFFEIKESSSPRIRKAAYAESIEQIEKARIPMGTKLDFLKRNGISRLPSLIDVTIRNDIAHLKIEIKDEQIFIRGKREYDIIVPSFLKLYKALKHSDILMMRMATKRWAVTRTERLSSET